MVVGAVLQVVALVIGGFVNLLPPAVMPTWIASGTVLSAPVAAEIAGYVRAAAPFLPIDTILTILVSILQFWPAIAAYLVFSWVWNHIPTIAGFGTH